MSRALQYTFKRHEKKYLLTPAQHAFLHDALAARLVGDGWGCETVCSLYFDTDDHELIRASLEKPLYKEKFRLRSYGVPGPDDIVFAELKKKFKGVVYKRRIAAAPAEIEAFLAGRTIAADAQIQRELQWFLSRRALEPRALIACDRTALVPREDPASLRVTFDENLRWRTRRLALSLGDDGAPLLGAPGVVMEIKTPGAVPLWLAHLLCECGAFPRSFSKYGECYTRHIAAAFHKEDMPYAE